MLTSFFHAPQNADLNQYWYSVTSIKALSGETTTKRDCINLHANTEVGVEYVSVD